MKQKIAIIGAGIGGLTLAQNLKDHAEVTIFEKARGVGGRMSTRYADPFYFDHGAHTFTARSKKFHAFLKPFVEAGIIEEWSGKVVNLEVGKKTTKRLWFEPHLVASPNMNSLCKKMAEGLEIQLNAEILPLTEKQPDGWHLATKDGRNIGAFDWVISTAPPAQTLALFHHFISAHTPLHTTSMKGCYALMLGFNRPWDKQWIGAKVRNNPLKWISINSTKPSRNKAVTAIVAHSRNNWAEEHMDDDMNEAQKFLISQFEAVTGIDCSKADYISTHRWKYAVVEETEKEGFYFEPQQGLAASSDWASTSRIEEVWINATQLSRNLANELSSEL